MEVIEDVRLGPLLLTSFRHRRGHRTSELNAGDVALHNLPSQYTESQSSYLELKYDLVTLFGYINVRVLLRYCWRTPIPEVVFQSPVSGSLSPMTTPNETETDQFSIHLSQVHHHTSIPSARTEGDSEPGRQTKRQRKYL